MKHSHQSVVVRETPSIHVFKILQRDRPSLTAMLKCIHREKLKKGVLNMQILFQFEELQKQASETLLIHQPDVLPEINPFDAWVDLNGSFSGADDFDWFDNCLSSTESDLFPTT